MHRYSGAMKAKTSNLLGLKVIRTHWINLKLNIISGNKLNSYIRIKLRKTANILKILSALR